MILPIGSSLVASTLPCVVEIDAVSVDTLAATDEAFALLASIVESLDEVEVDSDATLALTVDTLAWHELFAVVSAALTSCVRREFCVDMADWMLVSM